MLAPETAADLASSLREAAARGDSITLSGNSTKRQMAGPIEPPAVAISTAGLRRVLEYEPHDLTVSVEAGLPWCEFTGMLAQNRQMVPLDPPFAGHATVGGVIASNSSGPRRRLFGTARDLVIGMKFATLEGSLVQSGGMVVKNVAGLDMSKLMIGSFGTLGALVSVNFKLLPVPETERSFLLPFPSLAAALEARKQILTSQLQPAALDLLNPAAAASLGNRAWMLVLRAAGNAAAVDRYEKEAANLGDGVAIEGVRQQTLWRHIEEFTPRFLAGHPDGAVVRVSCTLKEVESAAASHEGELVIRAGSGVCYAYFEECGAAAKWLAEAAGRGWKGVIEYSPEGRKHTLELWPSPGGDLEIMRRVKQLFDPSNLLNRGRLYRHI